MDQVGDASAGFLVLPPQRRAVPAWRSFMFAGLGSLVLHGGMIALAFVAITRMPAREPLHVLSVELAPRAQLAESRASENPAASPAPSRATQPAAVEPQRIAQSPSPSNRASATTASPAPASAAPGNPDREQAMPAAAVVSSQAQAATTTAAHVTPLPASGAAPAQMPAIEAHVLDWLAHYRSYPRAARRAGIEGVVMVSTVMGRDGTLGESRIATSSGHPALDRAALELLARASPVPPMPDLPRDVELRLPIVYRLNR